MCSLFLALLIPKFYARVSLDDQVEVHILENTDALRYTLYWCKSFTAASCKDEVNKKRGGGA
jgi:hypothetical protein